MSFFFIFILSSFSYPSISGVSLRANHRFRYRIACISPKELDLKRDWVSDDDENTVSVSPVEDEEEIVEVVRSGREEFRGNESIWRQMKEIAVFAGPATGLWICAPLMSLIDTVVIGRGSSVELASLGPGTVVCDYSSYVFMFLSIATSNMVATSLARKDKSEVQHQISILLFVGFTCGMGMLLLTKFLGPWILAAFTGPKNLHLVPAANTYVQTLALLVDSRLSMASTPCWMGCSKCKSLDSLVLPSLGMKDSLGPLKALVVASAVSGIGDIVLCCFFGYGIAGAAWATMVSQVIAAFMMIETLNRKGFNAFAISVPSPNELLQIFKLAAPVFVTMMSKVAFYAFLTYFATSMGTITIAAHQVMIQAYCMCAVWGEPLSQTAQSFMPELIYGVNRNLARVSNIHSLLIPQPYIYMLARMLLRSLVIIGALCGVMLGIIGTSVPWLFPYIFTPDHEVIGEMHKVLLPYFISLLVIPSTLSLEGTLLAGRDLRFLSLSMSGCLSLGALLLLARFFLALRRLISPHGILYSEDFNCHELGKLRAA
ncbi:hypothetical protein HHK36_008586 [Tetracentron sinense]|uniref:Protein DETOXIFICATION n=1 Tax=Tetracentron sinense TaxID=13715 RepID=A0A834ZGZ3_TETSI|nr:hypothetical protein HHK36_008586 [Tetracentron sinense]